MAEYRREKIWDPVTRLWHWILVLAVSLAWGFGEFMRFSTIEWHFYCGYTVLGLMAFRLIWGFCGPQAIRFRALIPTPRSLFSYLRSMGARAPSGTPGHNPVGSLWIIGIIILLTAQASCGLFLVSDDFFESAPLAHMVSDAVSNRLTWWHKLIAKMLLAMVCLHLAAITFYYFWKKENLVIAMITGWKSVKKTTEAQR